MSVAIELAYRWAVRISCIWLSSSATLPPSERQSRSLSLLHFAITLGACSQRTPSRLELTDQLFRLADIVFSDGPPNSMLSRGTLKLTTDVVKSSSIDNSGAHLDGVGLDALGAFLLDDGGLGRESKVENAIREVIAQQRAQDSVDLKSGRSTLEKPLWINESLVSEYSRNAIELFELLPAAEFWRDWYQRSLDGTPQNWDLLRDVALIDNALWEEGGEALDRAVSLAVERHRLLDEVRRLLGSLRAAEQSSQAIIGPGHNHPPGPLEAEPDLIAACGVIPQALETAEQALSQSAPPPTIIRRIATTLGDAALAILRYCARVGDAAAMEAAKSIGKWGGAAGIAWYTANAESIQKLAQDLLQWAASAF